MKNSPRVLLVGAGAVGQVFGKYLQAAGCELSFLVKEKYAEEARRGYPLYELGMFSRRPKPVLFSGFGVHVSAREAAAERWDQVWLCVSSTALRDGNWVEELARATGEATWVMLQPALDDRELLLRWIPEERLVSGMIPFLSFQAPLKPGDPLEGPGTALWMPPMSRGLFSGPRERLEDVLRPLRAGGYPAHRSENVTQSVAIPTAVLTTFVNELESAGWRFDRFLEKAHLERFQGAAQEAVQIAARHTRMSASSILPLLRPAFLRLLLSLASRTAPFDLEAYMRVHFTKVGAQTRLMMRTYIDLGTKEGLPVQALRASMHGG
jgi:ketopantoate reductase